MGLRTRKAFWFASGMLLVVAASARLELVAAQRGSEAQTSALETGGATFESLGENLSVNLNNIAYTEHGEGFFDIYFACSSSRGSDPLRLVDAKDIKNAELYFNDEKRFGRHFVKAGKYRVNARNIAYIESRGDSAILFFNARILDSFARLTLAGADAEAFRRKK